MRILCVDVPVWSTYVISDERRKKAIGLLVLNVCLICSALLIVKVTFVITVFFLFLLCVSTILVNKDDHL